MSTVLNMMLEERDFRVGFGYSQVRRAVATIHSELYAEFEDKHHHALVGEYA